MSEVSLSIDCACFRVLCEAWNKMEFIFLAFTHLRSPPSDSHWHNHTEQGWCMIRRTSFFLILNWNVQTEYSRWYHSIQRENLHKKDIFNVFRKIWFFWFFVSNLVFLVFLVFINRFFRKFAIQKYFCLDDWTTLTCPMNRLKFWFFFRKKNHIMYESEFEL